MNMLHQVFFPAAVFLILLFSIGCDDPSNNSFTPKPEKKQSSSPSKDSPSAKPQPSPCEKKKPLDKKQEKKQEASQPRETPKSAADPGTASGKSKSSSPGGTGETSSGSGKKPASSSDKNEAGGNRNTGSGAGSSRPDGSGAGHYSPNGSGRKTVPADWFPADIKKRPQPAQLEIWNRLLSALKNLIVARQVNFSPLGAEHTQLTEVSAGQYKAAGRCIVIEKSGNQMAYEFECVAKITPYDATVLSVKFHLRN